MKKISTITAGLILGIAVFALPYQAAFAHSTITNSTVTKTKFVTRTVSVTKHHHSKKPYAKMRSAREHHHAKKHTAYKLKTKPAKLKKPKTKRHDHYIKSHKNGHQHRIGSVNHRHGRYLPHTHRQNDFINISPHAKRWPNPKPQSSLLEQLPIPAHIVSLNIQSEFKLPKGVKVAIVVREESNGVTIVRNVKETRETGVRVPADILIGVTDYPRPFYILNEKEIEQCERRLRTVGDSKNISVKIGNVTYCE